MFVHRSTYERAPHLSSTSLFGAFSSFLSAAFAYEMSLPVFGDANLAWLKLGLASSRPIPGGARNSRVLLYLRTTNVGKCDSLRSLE